MTFYTHRIRETFYDHLDTPSGNPVADENSKKYYEGMKKSQLYQNRLFFTVCYAPFGKEQRMQHKMRNIHEKQKAIAETLPEMREIVSKISASLARFHAKLLGIYERENSVYSSQLSFYQYLLSGHWQEVRLSSTPLYEVLGGIDIFCLRIPGKLIHREENAFSGHLK
ncbi:MAG: hypothetical protein ACR5LC_08185 [Symbiopectobacterium sp.]|uniref:hypothetical protein n=1 Tax=Symbiopectobacterium sp. TaxID=2952789 RepID=UPI003F2CCBEB